MATAHLDSGVTEHERRLNADQVGRRAPVRGRLIGLIRGFFRPYARQLGVIAILQVLEAAGNLYLPILTADIINNGVLKGDVGHIGRTGGIMLTIAVLLCVASLISVYLSSWVAMAVGADIRTAIYDRVQTFSVVELNRFGVASLTTRSVNDVQQVQLFFQVALSLLPSAIVTTLGAVILAVGQGPGLSPLLAITLAAVLAVTGWVVVRLLPMFHSVQVKTDRLNQVLREQIAGVRVARAFLRTGWEENRFGRANADITDTALRAGRVFALLIPLVMAITNLSSAGVFWFGAELFQSGSMSIGNLTAFLLYIMQIMLYVVVGVTVLILLPRAMASAERIQQVNNSVAAIADPPKPVVPEAVTGAVEFRHVTFGYAGSERPVLNDLTFAFRPGQTTAILGGTGSGKTTLLNLIPRFLDATAGAVLVNGIEVPAQSLDRLRAGIGLVPQTAFLFAGTVAGNLRFGRPEATEEELWRALDIAQARDFVMALPGRLDARIERGGANLSGGQRQRLSIARALVRRPSLYLFDDCFSALDTATDARLRAALLTETGDATVVIATQRAGTVMNADQIIVLDAGSIAGIGTHSQLMAGCRTYQEIMESQLGWGSGS
ncbi:ATP-binding cassette subfamily B protein [Thermocatellispora tengchongensis]|uniref:ATP-binding cassette subfamily B protein n=1 Tax=Thermocatellispora tengchongensis TaxID=1073253 RepID=A0A840PK93_9ACTN|nr:ABC transporter ATP-binding protein [Thermocatellispora tengchongensis]MBB5137487.1 ATP-binding cassette subfamily B protein [Thermocatellispora tengchongensis]